MLNNLKSMIEVLEYARNATPNNVFLQYKIDGNYTSITFDEFGSFVERMSASLYEIGMRTYDKVGMVSENLYKWIIADMAILSLGAIDVPRGADSTTQELEYILNHAEIKYCFVENPIQAEKVISIKKSLKHLKYIILFTGNIDDIKVKIPLGVKVLHFDSLLEDGKQIYPKYRNELINLRQSINENDLMTIIYTSGTTGAPKGVMLTHKNILHNIRVLPDIIYCEEGKERWLSILPIWHIFERTIEYIILGTCGSMLYSKPTARYLLPDFEYHKPTLMVSVPRIWEALYQGIVNKVKKESTTKWLLFKFFINIGIKYIRNKKILKNLEPFFKKPSVTVQLLRKFHAFMNVLFLSFWYFIGDKIIYSKLRERTGGCLRVPISGGGALPGYIEDFFTAVKIELYEGYGLTETSPVLCVKTAHRMVSNTVGAPIPEVEIFIGDEEGNPLKDQTQKGIVYTRGPNITTGYFKEEEHTKSVIKTGGWFNTGDLGRITITGELQLTGRAKDTIVLLGGENIEPAPIEEKLLELEFIHQLMVVGQDKKVLGALIVPDEEVVSEYAGKHGISFNSIEKLYQNEAIIEEIKRQIKAKVNTKTGFRFYERITFIKLLTKPFEPGKELTHSLKMKRNYIMEQYRTQIEEMFV